MVYSHRQRAQSAAPGAAKHNASLKRKTKAPYKIVFEQVTEKRRKLLTILSFNTNAPPGYTFIPAGDPQVTNRCKQVAREDGLKVYIVSTSKHKNARILSHEVHRIGHHFPSLVVEKACSSLGVSLMKSGHVVPHHRNQQTSYLISEPRDEEAARHGRPKATLPKDVPQAVLDTQAREAIKDLFPKMPNKDLHEIVFRAFEKGKDRVGTVLELPLSRRVQLAVVAHIRHVYTDYDKLLKTGTYQNARAAIEKPCLDLLAQWRSDEDDDDPNAMEEILREVIVIDDDDEENQECKSSVKHDESTDRDHSVEVISSRSVTGDMYMQQNDHTGLADFIYSHRPHSPVPEDRELIQHSNLEPSRFSHPPRNNPLIVDRDGIHRHRWQEALHRRRINSLYVNPEQTQALFPQLSVPFRTPTTYTEVTPPHSHIEGRSRKFIPLETSKYNEAPKPRILDLKGERASSAKELESTHRNLHSNSGHFKKVFIPAESHPHNSINNMVQPLISDMSSKWNNDYFLNEHPERRRVSTSAENVTIMRKIPQREYIDTDYNQQSHYQPRPNFGHILRSVEGMSAETSNLKNALNISHERASKNVEESSRFDSGEELRSYIADVGENIETRNNKRRRVENLLSLPSETLQPSENSVPSERTIFVPRGRNHEWSELHPQLSPSSQIPRVNPFIRRQSNSHSQPEETVKFTGREVLSCPLHYERSNASRNTETFHPLSDALYTVPDGSRQVQQNSFRSAFEASENDSLTPLFRGNRVSLQTSHNPFNSDESSHHAYEPVLRELPHGSYVNFIDRRAADQQTFDRKLQSDFARLSTGSNASDHPKYAYSNLDTCRASVPVAWDRTQKLNHGEDRTGVFLRELPHEKKPLLGDPRLRVPRSRLFQKLNNSSLSDADDLLPFQGGRRDSQSYTPVREEARVNSRQPSTRLTNDQRYDGAYDQTVYSNNITYIPAQPEELYGGRAGPRHPKYVDMPRWEPGERREIIVID